MSNLDFSGFFALIDDEPGEPTPTTCRCVSCGFVAPYSDCESFQECESWEMPQLYTIHICPLCEADGMEPHGFKISLAESWQNLKLAIGKEIAPLILPIVDFIFHITEPLEHWRKPKP